MLRFKKCCNICRCLMKYNKTHNLASFSVCDGRNLETTFHYESNQEDNRNNWYDSWWRKNNILMLSSVGVGLVFCSSYVSNIKLNEKKFFRSVQYGIEHEVRRYFLFSIELI